MWAGVHSCFSTVICDTSRYEGNEDFKCNTICTIGGSETHEALALLLSHPLISCEDENSGHFYKDGTEKPGHWKHIQWYPPSLCGCVYGQTWKLRFGLWQACSAHSNSYLTRWVLVLFYHGCWAFRILRDSCTCKSVALCWKHMQTEGSSRPTAGNSILHAAFRKLQSITYHISPQNHRWH